jgi:hypothetical protein
MALKNAFLATTKNMLSRRWGGHNTGVADPYITGYHFIYFEGLPELFKIEDPVTGSMNAATAGQILSATCTGVTPPGGTLNKIEFTGLGGVKWAVPGNLDYGNSISIKFTEMQGLPVTSIMHRWIKAIRDYRTGATGDEGKLKDTPSDGQGYSKKTYSSLLYYWTTAPDAETIEYYACYDGVFPTKDPADLHASDIESIGKLDIEIEFNVDYVWHENWVHEKCAGFAKSIKGGKTTIDTYGSST